MDINAIDLLIWSIIFLSRQCECIEFQYLFTIILYFYFYLFFFAFSFDRKRGIRIILVLKSVNQSDRQHSHLLFIGTDLWYLFCNIWYFNPFWHAFYLSNSQPHCSLVYSSSHIRESLCTSSHKSHTHGTADHLAKFVQTVHHDFPIQPIKMIKTSTHIPYRLVALKL